MNVSRLFEESRQLKRAINQNSSMKIFSFQLRDELFEKYCAILKNSPVFANKNNVLSSMWKICIYQRLDYFRRGIQHFKAKSNPSSFDEISLSCKNFIDVTLRSLCHLFDYFAEIAKISEIEDFDSFVDDLGHEPSLYSKKYDKSECKSMQASLECCHRILIFMGDLERHKQLLLAETNARDWRNSAKFYEKAVFLSVSDGNAHNQLALLSSYNQNILSTAYHYVRSISVTGAPFKTAKDNFQILLTKNSDLFQSLFKKSYKKTIPIFIKNIKSMKMIFTSILYCFHSISRANSNFFVKREIESFRQISESVMSLLNTYLFNILNENDFDSNEKTAIKNVIFEILIISIYFAHDSLQYSLRPNSRTPIALIWLLGFLADVAKNTKSIDLFFVPAIFADFCQSSEFFRNLLFSVEIDHLCETTKAQKERFWASLLKIQNKITKTKSIAEGIDSGEAFDKSEKIILSEEKELRGFSPLHRVYGKMSCLAPLEKRRKFGKNLALLKFDFQFYKTGMHSDKETTLHLHKRVNKIMNLTRISPVSAISSKLYLDKPQKKNGLQKKPEKSSKLLKPKDKPEINGSKHFLKLTEPKTNKATEAEPKFKTPKTDSKLNWRPSKANHAAEAPENAEKAGPLENFAVKSLIEGVLNEKLQSLSLATENSEGEVAKKKLTTGRRKQSPGEEDDNGANSDGDFDQRQAFAGDVCSVGIRDDVDKLVSTNPLEKIRFSETSKLQRDLISNGYSSSKALDVALNVKSTLERMTEADFKKMKNATLQFRPYFEAEKDALIKCTNISKELNAFKSENFPTAMECIEEIRKAQRLLVNSKEKDILARAREKLEHFSEIKDEIDKHAKELFTQERRARNELDRAHFVSFDERKKIYHAEMNAHLIDHERFRDLVFVDLDNSRVGERRGDRVAVSLEENGEIKYHAFVKNHKYAYVPTAPRSTAAIETQSKDEDWRAEFR